jgi:hypothetical protein
MQSQTISVVIEQPFDEVYGFLADPLNFPSWSPVHGAGAHHLHGSDWLIETIDGPQIIRYTEPNLYGVLDFTIFGAGKTPGPPTPSRLVRTESGCELMLVWRQMPGQTHEQYSAQLTAISTYFQRLKTLLESDPAD